MNNVDLQIENYTIAELMDIFSLQGAFAIILLVALSFIPKALEKFKKNK